VIVVAAGSGRPISASADDYGSRRDRRGLAPIVIIVSDDTPGP
jgi:hypothetical protein